LAENARSRRVVDGVSKPDSNYTPPDLQMIGDEDDEDEDMLSETENDEETEDQGENVNLDDLRDIKREIDKSTRGETAQKQLEKGQVPKYEAQPPEAIKKPPGGPAIKPSGVATKAPAGVGQGVAKTAQSATQTARNAGQAVAKAGQAIAKAAQAAVAAVRNAVVAIGALIETAPVWLPIVLIILGILIIVGGVAIFLKARQTPNANGASPTIAADILADRPWISKVLGLANDPNIASELEKLTGELSSGLSALENDLNLPIFADKKQQILDQINKIRQEISRFQSLPLDSSERAVVARLIVSEVGKLADIARVEAFIYKGETSYPVKPEEITDFGRTPHGRTYSFPVEKSSHRTFQAFQKDIADASDIIGVKNTPVYAAFSGKVIKKSIVSKRYNGGWYIYIQGIDQDGKTCIATYAHLNQDVLSEGTEVNLGDKVGTMYPLSVSAPHLHFELSCDGKFIVSTREEWRRWKKNEDSLFGFLVYKHLMRALNLDPYYGLRITPIEVPD
jgi:murein DD-endopeptidase MepM/ murein hydrolase activator NlpD